MFRGYRSIVLTLGLILALAGATPPKEQSVSKNSASQIAPSPKTSSKYSAYPDKYAESCYGSPDHDTADLCVQWRAAVASEKTSDTAWWGNIVGGVGAALSFISIGLVVIALTQTRKSIALEHPPRLLLTNVQVWSKGSDGKVPPRMISGEEIEGRAWIVNSGRGVAYISPNASRKENLLICYWGDGNLPMIRPYDPERLDECGFFRLDIGLQTDQKNTLGSGEVTGWSHFATTVPANTRRSQYLYVMGFVRYRTEFDAVRMLTFCRQYDRKKKAFKSVESHPNYELEE